MTLCAMLELLNECGAALYGPRFQRELARDLGVNERTVRRWVAGDTEIPVGVLADLERLLVERRKSVHVLISKVQRHNAGPIKLERV